MGHFPDFICRIKPMAYAKKGMLRVLTSFRAAGIKFSLARDSGRGALEFRKQGRREGRTSLI
jgi:hypothetical protein